MTNLHRLTVILTAVNFLFLAFGVAQRHPAVAQGVAAISKCRRFHARNRKGGEVLRLFFHGQKPT